MDIIEVHKNDEPKVINNEEAQQQLNEQAIDFAAMAPEMKTYSTDRTKDEIKADNRSLEEKKTSQNYMGSKDQMIDASLMLRNDSELLLRDKKWYRLFNWESDEMTHVKESVAYLNKLLDGEIPFHMNGNLKQVDTDELQKKILPAYRVAFDACDRYITAKTRSGAKHTTGIRRLNKVKGLQKLLESEIDAFNMLIDNSFMGINITDDMTNVRHLLGEVRIKDAVISRNMTEGNSSEVFRVRVQGDDKYFYVKKDEKLLHEDLPGYAQGRLAELQRSRGVRLSYGDLTKQEYANLVREKNEAEKAVDQRVLDQEITEEEGDQQILQMRAAREELRLEGKIEIADYDNGITFLTEMQQKVTGGDAVKYKKIYKDILAHDFDKFFGELEAYNATVVKARKEHGSKAKLIESLKDQKPDGWEGQVAELEKQQGDELVEKTELEWLFSRINIPDDTIRQTLTTISNTGGGLFKLFTRTLGKREELYGQQAERSGLSTTDTLSSNNTATSRLASKFGFGDVVTQSFKSKLNFVDAGKTEKALFNTTFSTEAPGEELFEVAKQARENNIPLKFSPKAMRQMNRLYVIDLATLQTDRHWRNIKAVITKNEGEWVVDTIKSYDHDQSFGNKNLNTFFKVETDPVTGEVTTKSPGFLPPLMMTVSKNSKLYKYAKITKMTKAGEKAVLNESSNILDGINYPRPNTADLEDATVHYREQHNGHDQYTVDPKQVINRARAYMTIQPVGDYTEENFGKLVEEYNPGKRELGKKLFSNLTKIIGLVTFNDEGYPGAEYISDKNIGSLDDRKKFLKLVRDTYDIYQQLDLSMLDKGMHDYMHKHYPYPNYTGANRDVEGYMDYNLQAFFYSLKLELTTEGENNTKLSQEKRNSIKQNRLAMEAIAQEEKENKKNKIREELQAKSGNLAGADLEQAVEVEYARREKKTARIPSILHMDREAFESINRALQNDAYLTLMLKDLNMTNDKKTALRERLQQIKDQALEAEAIVKEWAKQKGLSDDDIHAKFFLDEGDYGKIDYITDMALDPGMSYYSTEDTQFLTANKVMKTLMTEDDREKAKKITNAERNTERQRLGDLEGEYIPLINNSIYKVKDN